MQPTPPVIFPDGSAVKPLTANNAAAATKITFFFVIVSPRFRIYFNSKISSAEALSSLHIFANISIVGACAPFSHLLISFWWTCRRSASSDCETPAAFRAFLMFSPKFMPYLSFPLLSKRKQ